jgi:8-oxo-dGTP pyrophosphatase MutT (NUDIX family)
MTSRDFERIFRDALAARPRAVVRDAGLVEACVLVPVLLHEEEPILLFTRRTHRVETHKGQISFPGGVTEPGDANPVATALRETQEELGIDPATIEPVGLLDDLATPTGFRITPVVAVLRTLPSYAPNPDEVEEVFEAPLSALVRPGSGATETIVVAEISRQVWAYSYGPHRIWGATAAILRNFLEVAMPA